MPSVFLDTNVLIYAATAQETAPEKWRKAVEIMESSDFTLSTQVMAEFVSVIRRKAKPAFTEVEIEQWLTDLALRDPLPLEVEVVQRGRAISAEHRLNYYDGAILAAAERLGCDTVLSEDMTDGRPYGAVTVQNPFKDL